jgi:hypothetical protein
MYKGQERSNVQEVLSLGSLYSPPTKHMDVSPINRFSEPCHFFLKEVPLQMPGWLNHWLLVIECNIQSFYVP